MPSLREMALEAERKKKKAAKQSEKLYLTEAGAAVAMGEVTLRMKETGKTAQQVMDKNEQSIPVQPAIPGIQEPVTGKKSSRKSSKQEKSAEITPVIEAEEASSKEITMDTLRGLYWMASTDHIGDKKATRGQLKRKLNDLMSTKAGFQQFLKSLQEYVFS